MTHPTSFSFHVTSFNPFTSYMLRTPHYTLLYYHRLLPSHYIHRDSKQRKNVLEEDVGSHLGFEPSTKIPKHVPKACTDDSDGPKK